MKPDLSIIIVNYNSRELLLKCLLSIKECIQINYEVIIIDNASTDDSFEKAQVLIDAPNYRFIKAQANLGFSKANNLACTYATASVFHFLNPDTIVNKDLNKDYLYIIQNLRNVYITPLINKDGSIENSKNCIPSLGNNLKRIFCPAKVKYWYIGASVIISKVNFEKVGKWCEEYFMYAEDIDLFYRINKSDIKIVELIHPILHIGGGCSKNIWKSVEKELISEKSYYLFFKRNFSVVEYHTIKILTIFYLFFKHPTLAILKMKVWLLFLFESHKCYLK